MWVQLKAIKIVCEKGASRTAHPGDWVNVGSQTANMWLAEGTAFIPSTEMSKIMTGCGIMIRGTGHNELGYAEKQGSELLYPRTLFWDTRLELREELLPLGFHLLTTWEVAIPIYRYDLMADSIGTLAQRKKAEKVVRDLRVPLYDPRMVFVRRGPAGKELVTRWLEYRQKTEERLALLMAIYEVKPLIMALPASWVHNAPR